MKTSEINIRDPFILVKDGKYYLYGSGRRNGSSKCGFDVVISTDLENWSEPKTIFEANPTFWATRDYWAPEVHEYKGKFYLFASFKSEDRCRGTQILVCDTPDGTFVPMTEYPVTPSEWECLDGTLYIENGVPYIVFCHEWLQIGDGTVCALQLTDDLKESVGEPFVLFKASDLEGVASLGKESGNYITDGPWFHRCENGTLVMLWSTFKPVYGYIQTAAISSDGTLKGKWNLTHPDIYTNDGGHGMIFTDLDGKLRLSLHSPNGGFEYARFLHIKEDGDFIKSI